MPNSKRNVFSLTALAVMAVCAWVFIPVNLSYQEELKQLLSDNSPTYREIRKNGYVIKAQYLPMRYFELRHLLTIDQNATKAQWDSVIAQARQTYANGFYFIVTIGFDDEAKDIMNHDIGNFSEWSDNLQKYHFRMGEYIYLQTAELDEIKLSVYDFQNTFGYTKDRKMLLCFPREFNDQSVLSDESKFVRMVFKEWGWGIGKQSVEWDAEELLSER